MMDAWARRRAAVAEEEVAENAAAATRAVEAKAAEQTDGEILEELGLPDPEEINDAAEIRAFMADAVPARIRTRALRRLWRLNPVLANVDGLVEYGEDFTDAATVVENLQTAYQVGKGMLKHVEELARQAEAVTEEVSEADAPEELPRVSDEEVISEEIAQIDQPASHVEPAVVGEVQRPRRMQFSFEAEASS